MTDSETEQNEKKASGGLKRWVGYALKYLVPLLVTVLLCKLLFDGVDFNEMIGIIRDQCDFRWIGLALVISIFSHVFRAMRWRIQLSALGIKAPLFPLVLSIFGTYAVNLVLPRLGEIWRTSYIAKRQDAPFSTVFGSMVADRLADTVTVLTLTLVTFFLASSQLSDYFAGNSATIDSLISLATSPWLWVAVVVVVAFVWWFLRRPTQNRFILKIKSFLSGLWLSIIHI